jgi:hypothetical protein
MSNLQEYGDLTLALGQQASDDLHALGLSDAEIAAVCDHLAAIHETI